MRIYLDNCCFNRPYDDQSQLRISLETQAKLYVQNLIKEKNWNWLLLISYGMRAVRILMKCAKRRLMSFYGPILQSI